MSELFTQDGPFEVAVLGDSLVTGDWPTLINRDLGDNVEVNIFGEAGATLSRTGYEPYTESAPYEAFMQTTPDLVLIMLGSNDTRPVVSDASREGLPEDMASLISSIQALPSAPMVAILTPPPLDGAPNLMGERLENEVLPGLRSAAEALGVPLIDLNSMITDYPTNYPDGIHPDIFGDVSIAQSLLEPIQELIDISGWDPLADDPLDDLGELDDVGDETPTTLPIYVPPTDEIVDEEDDIDTRLSDEVFSSDDEEGGGNTIDDLTDNEDLIADSLIEGAVLLGALIALGLTGALLL